MEWVNNAPVLREERSMKTRHATSTAGSRSDTDKPQVAPTEESLAPDDVDVDVDDADVHVRQWGSQPVLIACVRDPTPEGSAPQPGRLLIISPTVKAFEELSRQSPCITEIWLLAAGTPGSAGPGLSHMDRIDEVASWTVQTAGGRPLLVLRGEGDYLVGIDDDGIFALGPSAVHWSGKGCYRGAPAPADAGAV
uniref:hypothetical protein n=1 Tax=Polaromonas sp. H6N TaxID=1840293 RepID=UPI0015E7EEF3|nr:hypothetical protein [Polaromonas sp. H6N]